MLCTVTTTYDPFHPQRGMDIRAIREPVSLAELAPVTKRPFICIRNGAPVLRKDWQDEVKDGEVIVFATLPQGGGEGGSNPFAFLLTVGLMVFAPYLAAPFIQGMSVTAAGAVIAGIQIAGAMLVNALLPPPKPPAFQQVASLAAPSPTYDIQSQGNYARLESAIPVQYGRVKLFPDFGAQPYAEYQGNEQYLYQLFVIGQGKYSIESINIEDTSIDSWDDITYEVIDPGGTLTLFPSNVATSGEVSGQELTDAGYIGPFVANASGTDANAIGIDIILSRGLYHYNTTTGATESDTVSFTIEAREIDDAGAPVGGGTYTVLQTVTITAATTTPQRYSYRYSVSAARYEVRAIRVDAKQAGSEYGNDVLWGGLRAYLPDVRNFGNVTLLAMRMRASNNLSMQASRKINVIATRKLFTWNPSTEWSVSETSTRSIAWALADALSNTEYGGKLTDSRINLQALYDLDAIWTTRGDNFDGRFDNSITLWEAVTQIAQAGRTRPYIQGGIVNFSRDSLRAFPVALYSMRNIVRGSFSVEYILPSEDTADAVEVSYVNADNWTAQKVTASLPGSTESIPAKISLFGVTDRQHAYREGMYQAASNRYRRRIIRFTTEMEGFIPSFGDLIAIQHDMPAWGQFAEVTGWNAGTLVMTLSEPMTFGSGTNYIGIRNKDGSVDGPIAVTAGANAYELVLNSLPDNDPYTGSDYERTQITFGAGETWRQEARVISTRPRGLYQVEIEAINEDPSVHTADTGVTAPAVVSSQLPTMYTAPVVIGLTGASLPGDPTIMLLSWQQAPGADYYIIEQSQDSTDWTRITETRASNYSGRALYGSATVVRIAAVGLTRGPWVSWYYGDSADYMWDADDTTLMWSATSTDLMWRY